MKVKNITNGPKGVNSIEGPVEIGPGETADVEMTEAEINSSKRMNWFEFAGYSAKTVPGPEAPAYEAKHRGGGSYSILDKDGKEVMEKLSKEDAEAFNAMSDEDKAAYIAAK